jgi:hypothetical protein
MTNLVFAITVTLLVTNTGTRYPMRSEPIPCPDGMIGCAVYHANSVPVPNPRQRWNWREVREIKRVEVPKLGLTNVLADRLVDRVETEQHLVETWVDGPTTTNGTSFDGVNWWAAPSELSATNTMSTNTTLSMLGFNATNFVWKLNLENLTTEALVEELNRRTNK